MNIPYTAVHFSVYESAKKLQSDSAWGRGSHRDAGASTITNADGTFAVTDGGDEEEGLAVQLVAGGLAGGCAAAVTTPLDVVKTRLQTEGVGSRRRYGTTAVVSGCRFWGVGGFGVAVHSVVVLSCAVLCS